MADIYERSLILHEQLRGKIAVHGKLPVSNRDDLRDYRDALRSMRNAVAALMEQGLSLEEIQARRPIRAQAEAWGQNDVQEQSFVATIHHGLGGR